MLSNKKNMIFTCLMLSPLMIASGVGNAADIFKCINVNAEVFYNDKPCPITNVERKIKSVKDPVGGYIPPEYKANSETDVNSGTNKRKVLAKNKENRTLEKSNNAGNGSSTANSSESFDNSESRSDEGLDQNSSTNTNISSHGKFNGIKKRVSEIER